MICIDQMDPVIIVIRQNEFEYSSERRSCNMIDMNLLTIEDIDLE